MDLYRQLTSFSHPANLPSLSSNRLDYPVESVPKNMTNTRLPGLENFCTMHFINTTLFRTGRTIRFRPFPGSQSPWSLLSTERRETFVTTFWNPAWAHNMVHSQVVYTHLSTSDAGTPFPGVNVVLSSRQLLQLLHLTVTALYTSCPHVMQRFHLHFKTVVVWLPGFLDSRTWSCFTTSSI